MCVADLYTRSESDPRISLNVCAHVEGSNLSFLQGMTMKMNDEPSGLGGIFSSRHRKRAYAVGRSVNEGVMGHG